MQNIHHFTKWCFLFGKTLLILNCLMSKGEIIWNVKKRVTKPPVHAPMPAIREACAVIVWHFIEKGVKSLDVSFQKMQKRRIIEV